MDGQRELTHMIQVSIDDHLEVWIENFIKAKRAENLARNTIIFYTERLQSFSKFAESQAVDRVSQITPTVIRDYLAHLESTNHNAGGQHACYRSLKVFLRWFWDELEPEGRCPIDRVKAPKRPEKILPPISLADVSALLDSINTKTDAGLRDKAIIMVMLDTGMRASETLSLNITDFDGLGELQVRNGKGGKSRTVFLSEKTRRALRQYLRTRKDQNPALWINHFKARLHYEGLRGIFQRLAKQAGLEDTPKAHGFRRAYALESLRAGCDLITLQRTLGHSDLGVLRQYLKLTNADLQATHARTSPVDRLK
jgi:site-specific recombinase XerD